MRILGPERYQLTYDATSFAILDSNGATRFSGLATSEKPKLYIASIDEKPVYVGITKQRLRQRLTYGWKAAGTNGYYGYAWRHHGASAAMDVWLHDDAIDRNARDIATVEAEVVFLIRQAGQWPAFQTEIHFYQSTACHRRIAAEIVSSYKL